MDGISAVGWAKRTALPVMPFCWISGAPLPRRTCFQQHRPRGASIYSSLRSAAHVHWLPADPVVVGQGA
eukprot:3266168-Pyramimonas_sp.AAC.1